FELDELGRILSKLLAGLSQLRFQGLNLLILVPELTLPLFAQRLPFAPLHLSADLTHADAKNKQTREQDHLRRDRRLALLERPIGLQSIDFSRRPLRIGS